MHQIREARLRRLAGRSSFQNERPHVIHPLVKKDFDRAMQDIARNFLAGILTAYDFTGYASIVDVGGGTGALLAEILRSTIDEIQKGSVWAQHHTDAYAKILSDETGIAISLMRSV